MRVILTLLARDEYLGAVDWYAHQSPGLEKRIRADFHSIRRRLIDNPMQFPVSVGDTRRALLRHFPYVVIFRTSGKVVQIIAFFHTSRDPLQWQQRRQ
jgi:plasmid stabilization system protein ParE